MDADGDGDLTRQEVQRLPPRARNFERIDADGDARISPLEFERMRSAMAQQRLKK